MRKRKDHYEYGKTISMSPELNKQAWMASAKAAGRVLAKSNADSSNYQRQRRTANGHD